MSSLALSVKVGTRVATTATFVDDVTDAAADPTTVRCEYRVPGGTTTTTKTYGVDPEIERIGVGVYRMRTLLSTAGTWWFQWRGEGAGGPQVVQETAIKAERTAV